jgi:hypothetical protein
MISSEYDSFIQQDQKNFFRLIYFVFFVPPITIVIVKVGSNAIREVAALIAVVIEEGVTIGSIIELRFTTAIADTASTIAINTYSYYFCFILSMVLVE